MHNMNETHRKMFENLFANLEARMIGFDRQWRHFDDLQQSLGARNAFPPFNLREVDDDHYRIELAVAGFTRENLTVTVEGNHLVVEGNNNVDETEEKVLHRGIASRRFRQTFALADHVEVTGAELSDGMLRVELARIVPEAKKLKLITIE